MTLCNLIGWHIWTVSGRGNSCYYDFMDLLIWKGFWDLKLLSTGNKNLAGQLLNFPWLSLICAVDMSKDKCNIEGIKGLTSDSSIQSFHYCKSLHKGRQLKECPLSSVTTDNKDTSRICYKSFKSFPGINVDTVTHTQRETGKKKYIQFIMWTIYP